MCNSILGQSLEKLLLTAFVKQMMPLKIVPIAFECNNIAFHCKVGKTVYFYDTSDGIRTLDLLLSAMKVEGLILSFVNLSKMIFVPFFYRKSYFYYFHIHSFLFAEMVEFFIVCKYSGLSNKRTGSIKRTS